MSERLKTRGPAIHETGADAPATTKLESGAPIALGRAGTGIPKREQTTKLRFKFE